MSGTFPITTIQSTAPLPRIITVGISSVPLFDQSEHIFLGVIGVFDPAPVHSFSLFYQWSNIPSAPLSFHFLLFVFSKYHKLSFLNVGYHRESPLDRAHLLSI
jgi:hypothetical protein